MSTNRPSFEKRERDRQKKAKAAAKRDKRLAGRAETADDEAEGPAAPAVDESAILARLEELHRRFDDEQISFDEFEEQRAALLEQLAI
jgi:hypothetical protein